jgi:hypothetical protein
LMEDCHPSITAIRAHFGRSPKMSAQRRQSAHLGQ